MTDELESIVYNIREGYAVITDENAFSRGITELYNSIEFWDNMTKDEKKNMILIMRNMNNGYWIPC